MSERTAQVLRAIPGVLLAFIALTDIGGAVQRARDLLALVPPLDGDQLRTALVLLGIAVALIGLFWDHLTRRKTTAAAPPARLDSTPTSPTDAERELAVLKATAHAEWLRNRLRGELALADERLSGLVNAGQSTDVDTKTEPYRHIDILDRAVNETLAEDPDFATYYYGPDHIVWSGLTSHEQVVAMLKIRRDRLADLAGRLL